MPENEVQTLNVMYRGLGTPKSWAATAATKAEVVRFERRTNFIDAQLAGTNGRMSALTANTDNVVAAVAQISHDGVQGAPCC